MKYYTRTLPIYTYTVLLPLYVLLKDYTRTLPLYTHILTQSNFLCRYFWKIIRVRYFYKHTQRHIFTSSVSTSERLYAYITTINTHIQNLTYSLDTSERIYAYVGTINTHTDTVLLLTLLLWTHIHKHTHTYTTLLAL